MSLNEWVILTVALSCIFLGAYLFSWLAERMLKRLGLQVHVFRVPDKEETEPAATATEPEGEEQEQNAEGPENATTGGQTPGIITGRCRGCDLIHVGLVPAAIELLGPGQYRIPQGVPAVCPRCWCKMNPGMATNTTPLPPQAENLQAAPQPHPSHRSSGYPAADKGVEDAQRRKVENNVPRHPRPHLTDDQIREAMEPRKDYEQPAGPEREHLPAEDGIPLDGIITDVKKVTNKPKEMEFVPPADKPVGELTDEELDKLTRPEPKPEEIPQCSRCNRVTGEMKPDKNGKLWCQACIDALGGPKPKPHRRKGK